MGFQVALTDEGCTGNILAGASLTSPGRNPGAFHFQRMEGYSGEVNALVCA